MTDPDTLAAKIDASVQSVIQPKRPVAGNWTQVAVDQRATLGYPAFAFYHEESGLFVISAVEVASDKDGIDRGPEYHISISRTNRRRCTSSEAKTVLKQFGLEEAEEDNHVPGGFVRNYWRPVADRLVGLECACKADEPAIREDKGDFVWRPA